MQFQNPGPPGNAEHSAKTWKPTPACWPPDHLYGYNEF